MDESKANYQHYLYKPFCDTTQERKGLSNCCTSSAKLLQSILFQRKTAENSLDFSLLLGNCPQGLSILTTLQFYNGFRNSADKNFLLWWDTVFENVQTYFSQINRIFVCNQNTKEIGEHCQNRKKVCINYPFPLRTFF